MGEHEIIFIVLCFAGGTAGYLRKTAVKHQDAPFSYRFKLYIVELFMSFFVAFIVHDLAVEFLDVKHNTVRSITALAAFAGTELLDILEKIIFKHLDKYGKE